MLLLLLLLLGCIVIERHHLSCLLSAPLLLLHGLVRGAVRLILLVLLLIAALPLLCRLLLPVFLLLPHILHAIGGARSTLGMEWLLGVLLVIARHRCIAMRIRVANAYRIAVSIHDAGARVVSVGITSAVAAEAATACIKP
jgi:hypothetical protein